MRRSKHHVYPSSKHRLDRGLTLIELLVVLAVLSILSAIALPYAELTVKRQKEVVLQQALREIRTAIDEFHDDWKQGKISKSSNDASEDGYPKELIVLVEGVQLSDTKGSTRKYLRRIPRNPMISGTVDIEDHWVLISYRDKPDTRVWGREDVYDIRSNSDAIAIDETAYNTW